MKRVKGVGFIDRSTQASLTQEDINNLSQFNILQLAMDLESGLIHSNTLDEHMDIVEYLKYYFLPENILPSEEGASLDNT